mmetsp:Transcript_5135/g.11456  ORF Transcript_5135/g.11456 Transcript_5135/m.11456 type:complete len:207 (+) Transcript_5135:2834-3454(+)
MGLGDHAVVLVRVHAERREQEVGPLRLEGLVQAEHVDAKHILGMVRHICQPHRGAAATQEDIVLGGNHSFQRRGHLRLRDGGGRHTQVNLTAPPVQRHKQGCSMGAVNTHALILHQQFQQRQDLHRAVHVSVLPVFSALSILCRPSISRSGLRRLKRWLLTLHIFRVRPLFRLVLRDLRECILNELPSIPKILGDLFPRLGIHANE